MSYPEFPIEWVRNEFPSLRSGQVFLDNPAGSQVPRSCCEALTRYLSSSCANPGGHFATSQATSRVIELARGALAELLGAPAEFSIVLGANMTSLTLSMSRAMARQWQAGDEVIVSDADHGANIDPWLALRERGIKVHRLPVARTSGAPELERLGSLLNDRTRLVALSHASNVTGALTDLDRAAQFTRNSRAWLWVDGVHYVPHGPVDLDQTGVDFYVCSAYKFFSPHVGVLCAKSALLKEIHPYKVAAAPDTVPAKFETGARPHEGLAGLIGSVNYLLQLGAQLLGEEDPLQLNWADKATAAVQPPMRRRLRAAMDGIQRYERGLQAYFLAGLREIPNATLNGIAEPQSHARVPTFSVSLANRSPSQGAAALAAAGINAWAGRFYADAANDALGLGALGSLRIGAVHYNTIQELDTTLEVLAQL